MAEPGSWLSVNESVPLAPSITQVMSFIKGMIAWLRGWEPPANRSTLWQIHDAYECSLSLPHSQNGQDVGKLE